ARSTASGATWTFIDPTPGDEAGDVWGVVAQAGGIVDICTPDGHFRSTNNRTTWSAANIIGGEFGARICRIVASPDESGVLFAAYDVPGGAADLFECDDDGTHWTQLARPNSAVL